MRQTCGLRGKFEGLVMSRFAIGRDTEETVCNSTSEYGFESADIRGRDDVMVFGKGDRLSWRVGLYRSLDEKAQDLRVRNN
jgi:hypothetical protein